jgi:phage gp45-like
MRGYKTQDVRVEITASRYKDGQLLVSGKGMAGQGFEDLPWVDPLGFHSRPKAGDIAYMRAPGGNGDQSIVMAAFEAGKVPELQEGERAMYDGGGNVVTLTADGWQFNTSITVNGDVTVTGNLTVGGDGTFDGSVTDGDGDGGA